MRKHLAFGLSVVVVLVVAAIMVAAFRTGQRFAGRMLAGSPLARIGQPSSRALFDVDVRDADGRPVPAAEVRLKRRDEEYWNSSWAGVTNGRGTVTAHHLYLFSNKPADGTYDLVARAQGFAPVRTEITLPGAPPPPLVMQRGREMRVRITTADGRALPETLRPFVVLDGYRQLWRSVTPRFATGKRVVQSANSTDTLVLAVPEGDGWFTLNLPDQPGRFDLLVDEPGFLRMAWSGPYEVEDGGRLEVVLPEPALLKIRVTAGEDAIRATEATALSLDILRREVDADGKRSGSQIGSLWIEPAGDGAYEEWLAPGLYAVHGTTAGTSAQEKRRLARFTGGGDLELAAGARVERALHFAVVSPETVRGDGRAILAIRDPDGRPSSGRPWRVTYSDGEVQEYPVGHGTLPGDGRIALENLRDNANTETYRVEVDGLAAGTFYFRGTNRLVEATFARAPGPGDRAPALLLTRLTDGAEIDTAAFAGQVVYYDFWATWCGPCKRPLGELHELALRRGGDWKDRVVMAAVSIDDDLPTLADHVAKHRWTAPLHLWAGRGVRWTSEAAQAFSIHEVPTGVLVDRDGRIVWRGHPGATDARIEQRIDDLLRQPGGATAPES